MRFLNSSSKLTPCCYLLMILFFFVNCKDDDDCQTLNTTVWEYYEKGDNYEYKTIIYFHESTFEYEGYEIDQFSRQNFAGAGKYVFDKTRVIFTEEGELTKSITAIVTGNKMVAGKKEYNRK